MQSLCFSGIINGSHESGFKESLSQTLSGTGINLENVSISLKTERGTLIF